jgi:DNA-binding LacI/PurR family transcriptional regulator
MSPSLSSTLAARILADCIQNGQVRPGDRLPTVRDLQQRYGASKATIAHSLGILEAQGWVVKRHGKGCYVRNPSAARPERGARTLGLVMPNAAQAGLAEQRIISPAEMMMHIYQGVERACRANGFHVLMAASNWDYESEHSEVRRMMEAGCEGVVLYPVVRMHMQLHDDYLRTDFQGFPVVLIDIAYPEQERAQVIFDNQRAGYEMTRRLIDEGHKRIVFMEARAKNGPLFHRSNHDRLQGYLAAMRNAGLTPRPEDRWEVSWPITNPQLEVRQHLTIWKQQADRATAVVAYEDGYAIFITMIAAELGIRIPEQLRVVGFDNLGAAQSVRPSIPTTSPDFSLAGEMAAELVFRHVRGEIRTPLTYMLPVPILWRREAVLAPG